MLESWETEQDTYILLNTYLLSLPTRLLPPALCPLALFCVRCDLCLSVLSLPANRILVNKKYLLETEPII